MIKKTENFMNNFTAETRSPLKREQKTRVMENLGRCIGIQLMYLVPYVLLMVILYVSVFGRAFALIAGGVSANDYQLMAALSRGGTRILSQEAPFACLAARWGSAGYAITLTVMALCACMTLAATVNALFGRGRKC